MWDCVLYYSTKARILDTWFPDIGVDGSRGPNLRAGTAGSRSRTGQSLRDGTSNQDVLLIHALPGGERLVLQIEISLALESLEALLEIGLASKVVVIIGHVCLGAMEHLQGLGDHAVELVVGR